MEQVVAFLFKYKAALFEKSQFGFEAALPLILIVGVASATGVLAYGLYGRSAIRLPGPSRVALMAIRVALVAVIVFCLMRPVIVVPEVLPQANYAAVLVDDSASMLLKDARDHSRLEAAQQLLSPGSPFFTALSEKFKLRLFKFSDGAERVESAGELSGTGARTDLSAALEKAMRDSAGLPMSGIVLLTDGAGNADADSSTGTLTATLDSLRGRGLPVYTVGVGQVDIENDVELVRASAPRRVLAGSPVTAEVLIRSGGKGKSVRIDLTEDSHPLRTQDVPVVGGATTLARVVFTPSSPGVHRYALTAASSPDDPVPDNNSQEIVVDVQDGRPRVLYIEGEPRWEYGKLRAAMAEEKNVVLVSVLRSADGKYYRQGVEKAEELVSGFPKSEEDLFKYDALIIGSVEATFFTFDQLRAIEQFVSRRGGTLLALGGSKALGAGGYGNTPLADLLPLYLRGDGSAAGESQAFKAQPAARGKDHPMARLTEPGGDIEKGWEEMPAITIPELLTETKPGATVILEARNVNQKNYVVPLLVEERYGRGRTMALLASDTWRWRMMVESKSKSFETFWRNGLRYLVESVRRQVEAVTNRSYYGKNEPVTIRAEVGDEKFINVANARLTATVTTPSGRAIDVPMKPSADGGVEGFIGSYIPDEDGLHRVDLTARHPTDARKPAVIGMATASFLVGPANREAHDAAQNRDLLKRIASDTGGAYRPIDEADALVDELVHTEGAGSIRVTYDLWDMPINFMLVVALAAAEWFVRKRKGLA
ncbi:MAG TPA: hypothetical protein VJH03_22910 [Blastocatellia bacterium]|nr:hypothetical protein [Blastocatellia bacterium]